MEVKTDYLPMSVPLSLPHRARFAALNAEAAAITARVNEAVQAIVGVQHDPVALANDGWTFALMPDAILCTPPQPPPARSDDA